VTIVPPEPRPGAQVLEVPELLYRAATAARDAGFRSGLFRGSHVPARVVSIGNLVAGGSGKTPLVALVAERFMAMGRRVAILSRGYGRQARGRIAVAPEDPEMDWRQIGDEPALLRRILPGLPMVIGADRVASAWEAIRRFGADTLVMDDGFQHRWLARDVDVVLLDALRPLDNGHLLPRGLLREPPQALARAHLLVLSADRVPDDWQAAAARVALWSRGVPVAGAVRVPTAWRDLGVGGRMPPEGLAGCRAVAFAGIARPNRFRDMVVRLGVEVAAFIPFRDHHRYSPFDLGEVAAAARRHGARVAVTTEKDAARLAGVAPPAGLPIHVLSIAMEVVWEARVFWSVLTGQPAPPGEV
jgi:tetraacyldisaccharide 4'-kinase